jgi:two-component system sensor histidine kinase KdpD
MPEQQRPDPEVLLQRVQEEERKAKCGKLKIYLGAAPGVGKTYTMLQDALAQRAQGLDVIVGVVESHGRQEIETLLKDLEIFPKQRVFYRDINLLEFDLDGVLKRHPALVLIDEMAHTNAPGLRHEKRWQDIKEILDRGIDVYTTLNVQHIESLNDDVAQIIRAPIKETVPDSMIETADTIELIDLPPEDLLKRLQEGKVYISKQAALAKEHFFLKGNLTALRELALRITAERVGAQVLFYRQGKGIQQIWATTDKILVCVGPGAESRKLIRSARRMATSLQAEWIAVYVERLQLRPSEEIRNQAIRNLRLAEQLGANTRVLTGFDIVNEVLNFAREQNVTQIMIWKHIRTRWRDSFFRNLSDEMLRHSGEIDIYMMTGLPEEGGQPKPISLKNPVPWKTYGLAISMVALITGCNFLFNAYLNMNSLILIYLLGVTVVALFGRAGPAFLASIFSILAYDFFFVPTFFNFGVEDIEYIFTLIVMLLVTQIISQLTLFTRRQAAAARQIEHQTSALYQLSQQLTSQGNNRDQLLETSARYLAEVFDSSVMILLPENQELVIYARFRAEQQLDTEEKNIVQWVYDLGQRAGLGTDTFPTSNALYMPLIVSRGTIGVLRIFPFKAAHLLPPEQMRLLEICINQIALVLERNQLQMLIENISDA